MFATRSNIAPIAALTLLFAIAAHAEDQPVSSQHGNPGLADTADDATESRFSPNLRMPALQVSDSDRRAIVEYVTGSPAKQPHRPIGTALEDWGQRDPETQPRKTRIETIVIEGGIVEITGNRITIQGGRVEIKRRVSALAK